MRLAAIAEDAWQKLRVPLGRTPPRLTHVVLLDQTELANGSATPLPYDTIVVTAVWPAGWQFIGNTDDWLRLAFTHEFTHIVHLDRSEGWARFVRGIFGRMPFAFPNLFLPAWQIEGIATYEESALTGTGRLHAADAFGCRPDRVTRVEHPVEGVLVRVNRDQSEQQEDDDRAGHTRALAREHRGDQDRQRRAQGAGALEQNPLPDVEPHRP